MISPFVRFVDRLKSNNYTSKYINKIYNFINISKSSPKQFDFTPFGSTALFPKIKFILGNIFYICFIFSFQLLRIDKSSLDILSSVSTKLFISYGSLSIL